MIQEFEQQDKRELGAALAEARQRARLLSTDEAAALFGLSAWELRRGFKAGIYPALEIGAGDKKRLRWRADLLESAILRQIEEAGG